MADRLLAAAHGTRLDEQLAMQTVQVSIGELVEAIYEDLLETYGDEEVALVAAQTVATELLMQAQGRSPRR